MWEIISHPASGRKMRRRIGQEIVEDYVVIAGCGGMRWRTEALMGWVGKMAQVALDRGRGV